MSNDILIGFSRPTAKFDILADLIRLVEGGTPYSHVFIAWKSESLDRLLIYEARGGGVNFTNIRSFYKHNEVVASYSITELSDEVKKDIIRFCVDNARTEYGFLQVLGIGLVRLAAKVGIKIQNPFKGGNICSEIAAKVIQIVDPSIQINLDNVGPKAIYDLLETSTSLGVKVVK